MNNREKLESAIKMMDVFRSDMFAQHIHGYIDSVQAVLRSIDLPDPPQECKPIIGSDGREWWPCYGEKQPEIGEKVFCMLNDGRCLKVKYKYVGWHKAYTHWSHFTEGEPVPPGPFEKVECKHEWIPRIDDRLCRLCNMKVPNKKPTPAPEPFDEVERLEAENKRLREELHIAKADMSGAIKIARAKSDEAKRLREERDAEERRSILLTEDCCRLREWQRKAVGELKVLQQLDSRHVDCRPTESLIAEAEGCKQ